MFSEKKPIRGAKKADEKMWIGCRGGKARLRDGVDGMCWPRVGCPRSAAELDDPLEEGIAKTRRDERDERRSWRRARRTIAPVPPHEDSSLASRVASRIGLSS